MDTADAEKRLQNSAYMDASMLDAKMLQGAEKKHDAGSSVHRTENRSCKRLRKPSIYAPLRATMVRKARAHAPTGDRYWVKPDNSLSIIL